MKFKTLGSECLFFQQSFFSHFFSIFDEIFRIKHYFYANQISWRIFSNSDD